MKFARCVALVIGVAALLPAAVALAAEARERALLAQLHVELSHFEALVRRAQLESEPGLPSRFDYVVLRTDLRQISRAIERHLSFGRRYPRSLTSSIQDSASWPQADGHD